MVVRGWILRTAGDNFVTVDELADTLIKQAPGIGAIIAVVMLFLRFMTKTETHFSDALNRQGEKSEKLALDMENRHNVMHDRYEAAIQTMVESAKQCHAIQRESLELIGAFKNRKERP